MSLRTSLPALFAVCLLCLTPSVRAHAQTVTFTGAPAYTNAELLTFTALKPGATISRDAIQAATQRLTDSGFFAEVNWAQSAKGVSFTLKPMAVDTMLPARFPNLILFTPEEIKTSLTTRVPLYHGLIPSTGNVQDQVIAALKAMLADKSIANASISATPQAPSAGTVPPAIVFTLDSPKVQVRSLTFNGASPAMQPKLDKLVKLQVGQPFDDATQDGIAMQLGNVYRNDGMLDAKLTGLSHPAPAVTADAIDVDLTATISEGDVYHLTAIDYAGSPVLTREDFYKQARVKPGDVASETQIKLTLLPVFRAYESKGYEDAVIKAPAKIDRTAHTVSYSVTVVPGEPYNIGAIHTVGLNEKQQKDFDANWRLTKGKPYDTGYVTGFLKNNTAVRSFDGMSMKFNALSDTNTHLVDLTLTFYADASLRR